MVESQFKIGDVVSLRSNGPYMTVVSFIGEHTVKTCWMDNYGEPRYHEFNVEVLKIVSRKA